MIHLRCPLLPAVVLLAGLPGLSGCTSTSSFGFSNPFTTAAAPPPPPPVIPPSIHAEEIVGSWGLAAYHREQDRARTQTAAKSQCSPKPYEIQASSSGGVMMLGHDNPQVQEMSLKGSAEGKTYVGPGTDPAGADDREVVSFDGRVLILKWVDPEVAGRYGNMVLVRCESPKTRTAAAKKRAAQAPAADGPAQWPPR
jgi:hypothetical protein